MDRKAKDKLHKVVIGMLIAAVTLPCLFLLVGKMNESDRRRMERIEERRMAEKQRRVDVLNALTNQDFGPEHWDTFNHEEQMMIITSRGGVPGDL